MAGEPDFDAAEQAAVSRVAANVRHWRANASLTQQDLAEAVGVQAASLQAVEAGRSSPSFGLLVRLAVVLDVELAEFFVEREVPARRPGRPRKT